MQEIEKKVTYSIGQFATIVGLSAPTIRYYEREKLLNSHRDHADRRYFTETDVSWVKFLLHLKGTGMSIQELKLYVKWRAQGDATIPNRLALLKETRNDFMEKYRQVQHHLQILNDKISWYEKKETGASHTEEPFGDYLTRIGHSE
ncbi:MerR family transcriptional regulator [Lentilactobacillus hilgardii]|uniref:MerR family transcriptional regulator n=1 Tax=Lentilactobacillus hilgardii TaxID=1588 RepID=UPI003FA60E6E